MKKRNIQNWLQCLFETPLYRLYGIRAYESLFHNENVNQIPINEMSEDIPIGDSLTAQQQSLLWNDEKYLRIAAGEANIPHCLLFDEHAEE